MGSTLDDLLRKRPVDRAAVNALKEDMLRDVEAHGALAFGDSADDFPCGEQAPAAGEERHGRES